MKMRLAGNDCAGRAKPLHEPGIARCVAVQVAIEMYSATGGRAGEVKAILYSDGQSPQRAAAIAEGAAVAARDGRCASCFGASPGCVLPQIRVAAGILVGAGKGMVCQIRRLHTSIGERCAQSPDSPRKGDHTNDCMV